MPHLTSSKIKAIALYFIVVSFEFFSGGQANGSATAVMLGGFLLPILFSETFAWFSSFGLMESFASDSREGLSPNIVSFLGWILLLIGCAYFLFNLNT